MARIVVLALLLGAGCSRESAPVTPPKIVRLPPVGAADKPAGESPGPTPKGRITLRKTPASDAEKRALASVIRWLDVSCPETYDVELSVSSEPAANTASVMVVYQSRDEDDRPVTSPGAHALVQIDASGEVENVIGGR